MQNLVTEARSTIVDLRQELARYVIRPLLGILCLLIPCFYVLLFLCPTFPIECSKWNCLWCVCVQAHMNESIWRV